MEVSILTAMPYLTVNVIGYSYQLCDDGIAFTKTSHIEISLRRLVKRGFGFTKLRSTTREHIPTVYFNLFRFILVCMFLELL